MMSTLPPLTILLGPHTDLSLALNVLIRDHRSVLATAGVTAMPSRLASPIARRAANGLSVEDRARTFASETAERPVILSAVNFLGPPHAGLARGEMFPEAEVLLARLADVAKGARLILCVDSLQAFFLAAGSSPLEARVQNTAWETLYELSWAELVHAIKVAFPTEELIVMGPDAAHRTTILNEVLGPAANALPDMLGVLRAVLSETGRAVLDRLPEDKVSDQSVLSELYTSFAERPTQTLAKERLGIDKVTYALLEQRFEEDVAALRAMSGVRFLA